MKKDSIWKTVLIVSKQGRSLGPGEGWGEGGNGVRPSQAVLSWGLMDENESDKDTKRGSSSVTKEHASTAWPFQTNSHPSVISHAPIFQKCFFQTPLALIWLSFQMSVDQCRQLNPFSCAELIQWLWTILISTLVYVDMWKCSWQYLNFLQNVTQIMNRAWMLKYLIQTPKIMLRTWFDTVQLSQDQNLESLNSLKWDPQHLWRAPLAWSGLGK